MAIQIVELGADSLRDYGSVPIAFTVESRLRVDRAAAGEFATEPVEPWVKDYDAIPGEGPRSWASRFDVSWWGFLGAFDDEERIGGAAVAWRTPGLDMLRGRDNAAVLWDIRVRPDWRGKVVGAQLFEAAAEWARTRRCTQLLVETQDINVPACRFYGRMGCTLEPIKHDAYGSELDEVQLIWMKRL
jgi:GNAT superfamily N-acetyltransferase